MRIKKTALQFLFFFLGVGIFFFTYDTRAVYVCRDPLFGCSNPTFIDHSNGGAVCPVDTVNCDDANDCGSSMIGYADARDACGYDTATSANFLSESGYVFTISQQSDGNFILGGSFGRYNGFIAHNIVRVIGATGVIDHSFNGGGAGTDDPITTSVIQSDGKILIGGTFYSYNEIATPRLARLNSDGTFDTSFDVGNGPDGEVHDIALLSDGKILIVGEFDNYDGVSRAGIARLNSDGSLDTTFDPGTGAGGTFNYIYTLAVQPNGQIIIGGEFTSYNGTNKGRLARINADGSLDGSFGAGSGANDSVSAIAINTDGKIYIGGEFTTYSAYSLRGFARLNTDGSYDTSVPWALARFMGSGPEDLLIQPDGKVVVAGGFYSYHGTSINNIARINTDGSLDTSFDPGIGLNDDSYALAIQSDGKIMVGGSFETYNGVDRRGIARANVDGSLDESFNGGPVLLPTVIALEPENIEGYTATGRMFVESTGGQDDLEMYIEWGTESGDYYDNCYAGFEYVGIYEVSCDMQNLTPETTYYLRAYATNSAGTGYSSEITFQTLADDTLVTNPVTNIGDVSAMGNATLDEDCYGGEVVPPACYSDFERYIYWTSNSEADIFDTPEGSCYAGTGELGNYSCMMNNLQPDTTYYVAALAEINMGEGGYMTYYGNTVSFTTLSEGESGSTDGTFAQTIGINELDEGAFDTIRTSDSGYLVVGTTNIDGYGSLYVVKFTENGDLDMAFGDDGTRIVSGAGKGVSVIQSSDGGYVIACDNSTRMTAVKLTASGNLDLSFGNNGMRVFGATGQVSAGESTVAIVQASDGGYLLAGDAFYSNFIAGGDASDFYIVKLDSSGDVDTNFGVSGTRTFGGANFEMLNDAIRTDDNGYLLVGRTSSFGEGSYETYIIKIDSGGGLDLSFGTNGARRIAGGSIAESVVQSSVDGGYVLTGSTQGDDVFFVKLTSGGSIDTSFGSGGSIVIGGGEGINNVNSIIQTDDGGYMAVGDTTSYGTGNMGYDTWRNDVYVIKLTSNGAPDPSFGGVNGTITIGNYDYDDAQAVLQDPDGSYVVAGTSRSFNGEYGSDADMYIVKFDETGTMATCDHISGSGGNISGWTGSLGIGTPVLGNGGSVDIWSASESFGGDLLQLCPIGGSTGGELLTTNPVTNISDTFAVGNATLAADCDQGEGNPSVCWNDFERYILWRSTPPEGDFFSDVEGDCYAGIGGLGSYSCDLTNLMPGTEYYVMALAYEFTGEEGSIMHEGNVVSFTTTGEGGESGVMMSVERIDEESTTAYVEAVFVAECEGGEPPSYCYSNFNRYIQWTTDPIGAGFTSENSCSAGIGVLGDQYGCEITGLTPDTEYYVRGFVEQRGGEGEIVAEYYSEPMMFTTTPGASLSDIIIPDPNPAQMNSRVSEGYISISEGSMSGTLSSTTNVNVTYRTSNVDAIFPTGTTTTEVTNQIFSFEDFTITNVTESTRGTIADSRTAFRLGITGTNLAFSQPITIHALVGNAYNDQELDILYQNEGDATWYTHDTPTCTVSGGICTFTTDHATIYTINGTHQVTGDTPININVEVQSTLSMDCYDTSSGTGDYDVSLGTVANPGTVTAGTPATGQSTCDVTTNDTEGYYLTLQDDNPTHTTLTHTDPHTGTIYEISDLTHWDEGTMTTENWSAPTTKGLGFSIISFPDTNLTNNTFDGVWTETGTCPEGNAADTNDYAGIPDAPETIAAVTQYEPNTTTTNICYKVDVPPSQPSGIYQGSVTYTATSDASSYMN